MTNKLGDQVYKYYLCFSSNAMFYSSIVSFYCISNINDYTVAGKSQTYIMNVFVLKKLV